MDHRQGSMSPAAEPPRHDNPDFYSSEAQLDEIKRETRILALL